MLVIIVYNFMFITIKMVIWYAGIKVNFNIASVLLRLISIRNNYVVELLSILNMRIHFGILFSLVCWGIRFWLWSVWFICLIMLWNCPLSSQIRLAKSMSSWFQLIKLERSICLINLINLIPNLSHKCCWVNHFISIWS